MKIKNYFYPLLSIGDIVTLLVGEKYNKTILYRRFPYLNCSTHFLF